MGARHSKRSVDISGKDAKETVSDDSQPLDGKLEKIEDGAKVAVNGASHSEPLPTDEKEHVPNGDPSKDASSETPLASPTSPVDESATASQEGDDSESSISQPPKKKDKTKRKWSLRSFSFSKKDKSKPGKDEVQDDPELVAEVVEEKAGPVVGAFTAAIGDVQQSVTTVLEDTATELRDATCETAAMVDEQVSSTKDKVEQITAKVAEKAEALVVKMEAMSIEAADAVSNLVDDKTDKKVADPELVVVPEVDVSAPEVKVLSGEVAVPQEVLLDVKACVPEVAVVAPKVSALDVTDTCKTGTVEVLTSKVEEVAAKLEVDLPKLDVDLSKLEVDQVCVMTPSDLKATEDEVTEQFVAVVPEVKLVEEMPPPLPASPPPSEVIADIVMEVVDNAINIGEAKERAANLEEVRLLSPVTSIFLPGPDTNSQTVTCDQDICFGDDGSVYVLPVAPTNSTEEEGKSLELKADDSIEVLEVDDSIEVLTSPSEEILKDKKIVQN